MTEEEEKIREAQVNVRLAGAEADRLDEAAARFKKKRATIMKELYLAYFDLWVDAEEKRLREVDEQRRRIKQIGTGQGLPE